MYFSGKEGEASMTRAGALALSLIAVPINATVLALLDEGQKSLIELRGATAAPATTMRRHLRILLDLEVVERHRENGFPGSTQYELTLAGRELMIVVETIGFWLANAPGKPIELGGPPARSAIKALVDAWSTSVLRALAVRPLSLTELDRLIAGVSYPSLERRLVALRLVGQVSVSRMPGRGGGAAHAVTDWLRRAVGPLVAAARWDHLPGHRDGLSAQPPVAPPTGGDARLLSPRGRVLERQRQAVCRRSGRRR
jgi:DNA-binding HxlR family transcriptional regulator